MRVVPIYEHDNKPVRPSFVTNDRYTRSHQKLSARAPSYFAQCPPRAPSAPRDQRLEVPEVSSLHFALCTVEGVN